MRILPDTWLSRLYPNMVSTRVNTIHHQAIKDVAAEFTVEARCPDDGIIEAVRRVGPSFVAAVQWHPEFHPPGDPVMFDDTPLLHDFLHAARASRGSDA